MLRFVGNVSTSATRSPTEGRPSRDETGKMLSIELASLASASSSTRWHHADAPNLWQVLDNATSVAEAHLSLDPKLWWDKMGHTAQVPLQVTSLRSQLDRYTGLRNGTICEVGFNAGHSAAVWLENTHAKLVEFDLLTLNYSHASRRFIEERYPGRVTFHQGPSRLTVSKYAEHVRNLTAPPCDLWLVDGDHGKNVEHDFMNALAASHEGTVFIVDDANMEWPYVRRFWRVHVAVGSIEERSCVGTRVRGSKVEKTWCVGEVAGWATTSDSPRLHGLVSQVNLLSREARNAAYYRKVRRGARHSPYSAGEADESASESSTQRSGPGGARSRRRFAFGRNL